MATNEVPLWFHEERAYAVVVDGTPVPLRSGLSHANAMRCAEAHAREGKVASVMHVVGKRAHEVDHYPPRGG